MALASGIPQVRGMGFDRSCALATVSMQYIVADHVVLSRDCSLFDYTKLEILPSRLDPWTVGGTTAGSLLRQGHLGPTYVTSRRLIPQAMGLRHSVSRERPGQLGRSALAAT